MNPKTTISTPVLEPLTPGGVTDTLAAVVAGARHGHYKLPDASVLAVSTYNRLHRLSQEAQARQRRDFSGAWQDGVARAAATTLVQALASGNEPGDPVADLVAREDEARLVLAARKVYDAAAEQAKDMVQRMLSEALVVPALTEALDEVYAEVRRLPSDTPTTAQAALDANESGTPGVQEIAGAERAARRHPSGAGRLPRRQPGGSMGWRHVLRHAGRA